MSEEISNFNSQETEPSSSITDEVSPKVTEPAFIQYEPVGVPETIQFVPRVAGASRGRRTRRKRGSRRGRPSWRALRASYAEQHSLIQQPPTAKCGSSFHANSTGYNLPEEVKSTVEENSSNILVGDNGPENLEISQKEIDQQNLRIAAEEIYEFSDDMVGKNDVGEKDKVLQSMSFQFNSSEVAQVSRRGDSHLGRRGRRGSRGRGRKKDPNRVVIDNSAFDNSGLSLVNVNPVTHALKRVRKSEAQSGSERDSGEDSNSFIDDTISESGRSRTTSRLRNKIVPVSNSPVQDISGVETSDYPKTMRGGRRSRGRPRGAAGYGAFAILESPQSGSSNESQMGRNRERTRNTAYDDFILDETATRGRGKARGRGRGSFSKSSVETPVTSDIDENTEETIKKSGRAKKEESSTPDPIVYDSQKVKKKKKHFKGLKYSFGKKKKKPKLKFLNKGVADISQETESLASEDIDADSFDSSSQDMSRRLLLLPGEHDPYDPHAEFDDSHSEKSMPPSLNDQRKSYLSKGKDMENIEREDDNCDQGEEFDEAGRVEADWSQSNQEEEEEYEEDDGIVEEVNEEEGMDYEAVEDENYEVLDEVDQGEIYDDAIQADEDEEEIYNEDADQDVYEEEDQTYDEQENYEETQDQEYEVTEQEYEDQVQEEEEEQEYEEQIQEEEEEEYEENNDEYEERQEDSGDEYVETQEEQYEEQEIYDEQEIEQDENMEQEENENGEQEENENVEQEENENGEQELEQEENENGEQEFEQEENENVEQEENENVDKIGNEEELSPKMEQDIPETVEGDQKPLLNGELLEEKPLDTKKHGLKRPLEEEKGDVVRKSKRLSHIGVGHPLAIAAPKEETDTNMVSYGLSNVLCKCRVKENPKGVNINVDVYCQGIDSFDGRMIGCSNLVTNESYLRVSGKIPFMLLCSIHRHRLRRHNCCPGCGLFCTQGIFSECRWDKLGSRHYYHKLCGLLINGQSLCPHCGTDQPAVEVHLELKLSRKPIINLKQHQETKGLTSSARMSLSKSLNCGTEAASEQLPDKDAPFLEVNGKLITASKLPTAMGKEMLIAAIEAIRRGKTFNIKASAKAVYWSCKSGDLEKLLHVLANGVPPNARVREYGNQTGLHTACNHACLPAIHILVSAGASLDLLDTQLQTPLMIAIAKNLNDIVHYLVQAGASLKHRTAEGMTCLHLAAKSGNFEACRHILDSGRLTRHTIDLQDDGGWTPLVWASENRCINVVKILLDRGANPQICDVEQNTALHWAAFSGSTHICSMVIDRGCSLRSMNAIGDTPLHIAARQNHVEAVVLLLARGANLDIKNAKGQTPLDCAYPDSNVFLQLTLNKELKDVTADSRLKSEKILSSDIAAGKEVVPIPCVNGVDNEGIPKDYVYIAENCEALNVNIDRTITSLKWCECEDGCNSENCICSQLNFQCWYDLDGRLLNDFNYADPPMIFECNRACSCSKLSCQNRVVQHGMGSHLQLYKTDGRGWGIRALREIPKGTYVCEYVGEIITDLEADQREDDSYLFDLDNRDSETFCIDARQYGNVARFINHLCQPNLTPVKMFIDHQDLIFPRIAFFANRDIEADEELGFDYGEKFWIIKYKHFTCKCGSTKCKYSSETIYATLENYNRRVQEANEKALAAATNV